MDKSGSKAENRIKATNVIITASISIAALVVSIAQVVMMKSEIDSNRLLHKIEMDNTTMQSHRSWLMDAAKFVLEHRDEIFSGNSEEIDRVRELMDGIFPPEVYSKVSKIIEESTQDDDQKKIWRDKRRNKYRIQFFPKQEDDVDWSKFKDNAMQAGFESISQYPSEINLRNNAIVFGDNVNPEDVKDLALIAIDAGVELKSIAKFQNPTTKNTDLIQILARDIVKDADNLSNTDIQKMSSFSKDPSYQGPGDLIN